MTTIDIQRDMLNQVAKKLIKRIKELKIRLEEDEKEERLMGHYEDCGQFYSDQVTGTKAKIEELVSQKISIEKWRKSLKQ